MRSSWRRAEVPDVSIKPRLIAGIDETIQRQPVRERASDGLDEAGVVVRFTGDNIALSPPPIIETAQIDRIVTTIRGARQSVEKCVASHRITPACC